MKYEVKFLDKKSFIEITKILEINYNKELDREILKLWYKEFKEYQAHQYREIIQDVIRNCKFMPNLAEIRQFKTSTIADRIPEEVEWTEELKQEKREIEEWLKQLK